MSVDIIIAVMCGFVGGAIFTSFLAIYVIDKHDRRGRELREAEKEYEREMNWKHGGCTFVSKNFSR